MLPRKNEFNSEFPVLLGSMELLDDKLPRDLAYWSDWEQVINAQKSVSEEVAFEAMLDFLEINRNYSEDDEIMIVINHIKSSLELQQAEWHRCVQQMSST